MASLELQRLWQLHKIDTSLLEVRKRAAALDPGRKVMAEMEALQKEEEQVGGHARQLQAELTDLELSQKTIDEKIKKIDKQLYGGSVVNPREVENLEKEIVILKRQRASHDERILQLWEELPPAKEASAEVQKRIEVKKGELAGLRKLAMGEKEKLEAEFKRLSAMRPEATKNISPTLLVRYDAIRQKQSGEGMAEVKKPNTCLGCGTFIPERTMDALKNDRVATCESCHRILYYTEGITA